MNNMINPANYYNPFAKYNYISKTRGVYIPRDAQPLLKTNDSQVKSTSIYSENYDAESDIMAALNTEVKETNSNTGLFKFINKFLN